MNTFPEVSVILRDTRIIRKRAMPEGVFGEVYVDVGQDVLPNTQIVAGIVPSDYVIVDVAYALGLDPNDEQLRKVIPFKVNDPVKAGDPLAVYPRQKRLIPTAPTNARVSLVERGRVILQVRPQMVSVEAQLQGRVAEVLPGEGAVIEARGAVMQCAWGNGRFRAARFAFEPGFEYGNVDSPQGGLIDLLGQDVTLSRYRGMAIVLLRPLTEVDLEVVQDQEIAGIVAPSMPVHLREKAMQLTVPVILTEGFGRLAPTLRLFDLLVELQGGNPLVMNAALPDYRRNARPELIVSLGSPSRNVNPPALDAPLRVGLQVRARRAPFAGRIGDITDIPTQPVMLANGLRVRCAQVKFADGERAMIPLANLESLGEQ